MPSNTQKAIHDVATRAHSLRSRIYRDERELAIAYPDQVAELERNIETFRSQLSELEPQIEEAKEAVANDLREAVERCFAIRELLFRLNGYMTAPGFDHGIFTSVRLGGSAQTAEGVKAALLDATRIEPYTPPDVPEAQRVHEESLRNERAGLGYFTDDALKRKAENPATFWGGAGARLMPRMPVPEDGYELPTGKRPQYR